MKSAERIVPPYEPNETESLGGGGRRIVEGVGVSSRDAVSILFAHANYSSWVTLLEIEGIVPFPSPLPSSTREEREAGRSLPPLALGIS